MWSCPPRVAESATQYLELRQSEARDQAHHSTMSKYQCNFVNTVAYASPKSHISYRLKTGTASDLPCNSLWNVKDGISHPDTIVRSIFLYPA